MKDLVVGAGLVGLYQALVLLKQGNEVTVLEKRDKYGGKMRTIKYEEKGNSYYFDIGPHITPSKHRAWNKLCMKIDCVDLPTPQVLKFKLKKDLDLFFPPSLKLLSQLNIQGFFSLLMVVPTYLLRSVIKLEENNLKDVLINSWGDIFCLKYIKPLVTKLFKFKLLNISKNYSLRVKAPKIKKLLFPSYVKFTRRYPKYGAFEVIKYLRNTLIKNGCKISLETEIKDLNFGNNSINVKYKNKEGDFKKKFDRVFWSGSLHDLAELLDLKNKNKINYRNLLTINLAIDEKNLLGGTAHTAYISMPDIIFHRLYEPKKYSPYMAPKNKTSVCLEITLKKEKSYNLEKLIEKAIVQFRKLYDIKKSDISYLGHNISPNAYPLLFNNYEKYLNELESALPSKFFLIGRTGSYYPYSIHDALDTIIDGNGA